MGASCSTEKSIAVRGNANGTTNNNAATSGAPDATDSSSGTLMMKSTPSGRLFKTRPSALDSHNHHQRRNDTATLKARGIDIIAMSGSSGADDLIALDAVDETAAPGIERFEGDAIESQVEGFGGATSVTAPPAVMLQSVQSVSAWFETISEPIPTSNANNTYSNGGVGSGRGDNGAAGGGGVSDDEHAIVSPSADVVDEMKNDDELADAERLAPVTHYDATSVEDRQQRASRRVVDPLKLVTPKLPPAKKCTFFSF